MRKNLPIERRNPFFLYAAIRQTKPLKHVVVTDGNELTLLSLLI